MVYETRGWGVVNVVGANRILRLSESQSIISKPIMKVLVTDQRYNSVTQTWCSVSPEIGIYYPNELVWAYSLRRFVLCIHSCYLHVSNIQFPPLISKTHICHVPKHPYMMIFLSLFASFLIYTHVLKVVFNLFR